MALTRQFSCCGPLLGGREGTLSKRGFVEVILYISGNYVVITVAQYRWVVCTAAQVETRVVWMCKQGVQVRLEGF